MVSLACSVWGRLSFRRGLNSPNRILGLSQPNLAVTSARAIDPGTSLRSSVRGGECLSVIAETIDPDGRPVVLDPDGWDHILHEHRELAPYREEIMATVSAPDDRRPDPRPGRERYYQRDVGPSRWLFVVVHFNEMPARIVTAYANRKDPPGLTIQ